MRLCLRPVTLDDAAQIATIYEYFVTDTPVSFESVAPDTAEIEKRIRDGESEFPWLVCDSGGTVAGYAYASRHRPRFHYRWSVDVSVYVEQSFRRRGIGRALYASLLEILSMQRFVMAHAGITLPNDPSIRLHESVGFQPVGVYRNVGFKLGGWHDVGWWQRELAAPTSDPAAPLLLSSVQGLTGWCDAIGLGQALLTEVNV